MLDKSVRLILAIVFSIFLSGCSAFEKSLLFQKNMINENQETQKIEKRELQTDQLEALREIERKLENITLNITKLSNENTKTFEKISLKVKNLESKITSLQIASVNKEETNKKIFSQTNSTNQLGREDYQKAFELLKEGNYETAMNSFISFIEVYEESEFIDDAKYWLAETYYAQRAYDKALEEFDGIIIQFPDSGKIPETILKSGFCYVELGDLEQAKKILNLVINKYPNTSVSRLAVQKLKTINTTAQ